MNDIHPSCIIDDRVKLGKNNKILPHTIIWGPTEISDNNIIGPHVVIGGPGQDTRNPRYDSSECLIRIGSNNIIREFTGIQKPCYTDMTFIGDDVYLMQSVHIPHDATIQDKVIITPMTVLAGHTTLLKGANMGLGCAVHQFCVVGHFTMVGMQSALMKHLKPFAKYVPGKPLRVNEYSVNKYGYTEFSDEIARYVLEDKEPVSAPIQEMVQEFQGLTQDNNRGFY